MNDSVFNTLAAVALMCYGHFHGSFSSELMPLDGSYDSGFEQCAVIIKELEAERARRAKAAAAKQADADRARVANAVAALLGRPFKPELTVTVVKPTLSAECEAVVAAQSKE